MPAKNQAERYAELRAYHIEKMRGYQATYHVCHACWVEAGCPHPPEGQDVVLEFYPPYAPTLRELLRRSKDQDVYRLVHEIGHSDPRARMLMCAMHRKRAKYGDRPRTVIGGRRMYPSYDAEDAADFDAQLSRVNQDTDVP